MINRRDFIKITSATAALAASGQLPLWAAKSKDSECYAVEGFADLLKEYKAPVTSTGMKELRYKHYMKTQDLGEITVTRKSKQEFLCNYATVPTSSCKATLFFKNKLTAGLDSWTLTSSTTTRSSKMQSFGTYRETGKVTDGEAVVKNGKVVTERFKTTLPIQPDFTLPLVVPTLPAKVGKEYRFALLREGTFFFADQTVFFDGMATIPTKDGNKEFKNYLHVGDGTLPTNYLVDENRVTVIVTHGIVSEWLV